MGINTTGNDQCRVLCDVLAHGGVEYEGDEKGAENQRPICEEAE